MSSIKITCTRCGGSGNFSFNLIRGTVCFGCNGSGTILTTEAKIAAAKKAKIKADVKKESEKEVLVSRILAYNEAKIAAAKKAKIKADVKKESEKEVLVSRILAYNEAKIAAAKKSIKMIHDLGQKQKPVVKNFQQ